MDCRKGTEYQPDTVCQIEIATAVTLKPTDEFKYSLPEGNSFDDINEIHFQHFITLIPNGLFEQFPELKNLSLFGNKVHTIFKSSFLHADKLRMLNMMSNDMQRIEFQVFSEAWGLEVLELDNNHISSVDNYAFDGLLGLKKLALTGNRLRRVTRLMLANLPSLELLHLNNNQIEEIEEGALILPNLKLISLSDNRLKLLSHSVFAQTPALAQLWAKNNDIQHINNALNHLSQLEQIILDNNRIEDLDLKTLTTFDYLKVVYIANSPISLDALNYTFDELIESNSPVSVLSLGYNKVVNGPVFEKLRIFPNLEEVHLMDYSFKDFDLDVVRNSGLYKLREILINPKEIDDKLLKKIAQNSQMQLEKINPNLTLIKVYE